MYIRRPKYVCLLTLVMALGCGSSAPTETSTSLMGLPLVTEFATEVEAELPHVGVLLPGAKAFGEIKAMAAEQTIN